MPFAADAKIGSTAKTLPSAKKTVISNSAYKTALGQKLSVNSSVQYNSNS